MANVGLCGGYLVDDTTLKIITVNGKLIMSTTVKDDYPVLFKAKCGGFYVDGDIFKVDKNGVLTKKNKLLPVNAKNVLKICCGGYPMDNEVFAIKGKVLSYIGG